MDSARGTDLRNIVREAGQPWGIGPGNPNPVERIESGLLSYGGDTVDQTNPFELRLGKFIDLGLDGDVIGIKALGRIHAAGIKRHQLGVVLEDQSKRPSHAMWYDVLKDSCRVGSMTYGGWSPRAHSMIGCVLVTTDVQVGDKVDVIRGGISDVGTICEIPFF